MTPRFPLLLSALMVVPVLGRAGVTVTENTGPGATSWPGSPLLTTVTNPTGQTSVVESFNGGGGNTNLSQTFTISGTNLTLQTIDLYAGSGSGTGSGATVLLRLYDLGNQAAPNPSSYSAGTDLFNSGNGLSISYTVQTAGILKFDFTGSDQVTLQAGHMYSFELNGVSGTTPLYWQRGTNDTYAGGAAYRNKSWINGSNARDFALALYGTLGTNDAQLSGTCTMNWTNVHQRIDGFGGGVVFLTPGSLDPVTDANMDTLFGTANSNQLGLTLLRVRIDPTTNWSAALSDAKKAVTRGAGVLATPWTPPAWMKDNNSLTNGGSLLPSQYGNYAAYLKSFADYLNTNGAPLRAISVQNEPDWPATYEACIWSATQFLNFFRTNAAAIGSTPVMMPESYYYNFSISDPTLNDAIGVTNVALVGGHLYGVTAIQDYTNAHNKGKATWMTEFLLNDQTMGSAITTAGQIHDCLTTGDMSAYIWWKCLGDSNGLVNASGVPQKRGFAMAQFSRFIHTNYVRVGVTYDNNAAVSSYKDPVGNGFAIVAINSSSNSSVSEAFSLTNFNAASVTPWVTSASQSLAVQASVTVSNASFTYVLPPQSVVTFVGQASSNTPPAFAAIADRTVNAGMVLALTNSATDPDVPAQTLTFTVLSAPTNATLVTLDSSNALFTWRPLLSQAASTNSVRVKVVDSGTPPLSVTNSFTITVNPVSQPVLSSITVAGGHVSLVGTGFLGPDYTLLTSTNLVSWSPLATTNPASMPFIFSSTNATDPARFYRIQIGP